MATHWQVAADARAVLVVEYPGDSGINGSNRRTEHYHPPYPYSDEEQAMFDRMPGLCSAAAYAPLPGFMMAALQGHAEKWAAMNEKSRGRMGE